VFEFLWHYLKELATRRDRVSFLNALQILIGKLKNPQTAMNLLVGDIFNRTAAVNYSDRNGLMLGSILLRLYNRDERSNIELTPEEVLLVYNGLNPKMVDVVQNFIEENKEKVIQKIKRVTDLLLKVSLQDKIAEGEMQPRFLLYLMREFMIFLALAGGDLAHSVINGVVREFGNPDAPYYKDMKNKENLRHSLQLLQVATRALRRFNNPQADIVFDEIAGQETLFVALYDDPSHSDNVRKVMERIRQSI